MSGLAYKKDALAIKADKMVRVLRGGNIGEEQFYFKGDDVFISSELVKPELYLRKNYMITPAVSSLDHIGKIALINKDYSDTVVGGFVLMLIPHFNDDVVSEYLLYAFAAKHHRDNCRNITHKSGQAFYNLSREQMMNLPVPIPPREEMGRIIAETSAPQGGRLRCCGHSTPKSQRQFPRSPQEVDSARGSPGQAGAARPI